VINVKVPAKFMRSVLLTRYTAGSYINGVWQDGLFSQTSVHVSVQPLTTNELRLLPEGDRKKLGWKIFANFSFSLGDDSGIKADELVIDGVTFRISDKENFQVFGHSEAIFIEATE